MFRRCSLLFFLLVQLVCLDLLAGQQETTPTIFAARKEISGDKYICSGDVEVIWSDYHIYADYLEYNMSTNELMARGRVTMNSGDMSLSGERLHFNTETQTGDIYVTDGVLYPYVRYFTDKLSQTDSETLRFDKFNFTSCTQLNPRWMISSSKGKIKKDEYISLSNVVLKVKKIPVFYIPYLRYPLKEDGRSTGILFPVVGNSDIRGFFFLNSFFWNIKPNLDTTLYVDYYSKAGVGLADEIRYLFPNVEGNLKFYYFSYFEDNIFGRENAYDYYIKAHHKQTIEPLKTTVTFSVDRQSDPAFLRLFDNSFDRLLFNTYRTTFFVETNLNGINFTALARKEERFYTFQNISRITQALPSLTASVYKKKIAKLPGYFSLNAAYDVVMRGGKSLEEEPEFVSDFTSRRMTLVPGYSLDLFKLPWLSTSLNFSSKNTLYEKSRDPQTEEILDTPLLLNYNTASATITGPIFYKIFSGRRFGLKHLIEPKINIRYVSKVMNRDRMIPVDTFDYPSWSYVGFSLVSRLLQKDKQSESSPRDILSHTISQNYYFDPAEASYFRKIDGIYPKFSELNNTLRFEPLAGFSLNANLSYNFYRKQFRQLSVSLNYQNPDSFLKGSLSYSSYSNPYAPPNYIFNRTVVRGNIDFNLDTFPIKLNGILDYDLTDDIFRHGSILATFDYQCVQFHFEYRVFNYFGRVESQFNLGISFGNLGLVNDFLGAVDSR